MVSRPTSTAQVSPAAAEPLDIARLVLPGDWDVLDQHIVFTFDGRGIPVAVRNERDPRALLTNLKFGASGRMTLPFGTLDATLFPGTPFINAQTGEAHLGASALGSNVVLLGFSVRGTGAAEYEFNGWYDPATEKLTGTSRFTIFFNESLVYADTVDEYVLKKRDAG